MKTLKDSPKLRTIDFFLDDPLFSSIKKEVIEHLGVGKQTFYKHFKGINLDEKENPVGTEVWRTYENAIIPVSRGDS